MPIDHVAKEAWNYFRASFFVSAIPEMSQNAILVLLLFPYLTLKKTRHSLRYDSSFSKSGTKKSRRPKHSLLKSGIENNIYSL